MNTVNKSIVRLLLIPILCLGWSEVVSAKTEPTACVELGALVWNDWTSTDAGGSGMPAGETVGDYVRCKSCHGWDRLGMNGGYVRQIRTADQPNAGLGDSNTVSRDIAPGMGDYYHIYMHEVLHAGIGRAFEDGSGSWVELGENPTPAELAAHAAGFTLGNLHPDFSTTGANAGDVVLTQEQLECVVDFVNFGDSDPKFYFMNINTDKNPAEYIINEGASYVAGQIFYEETCQACHGEPSVDHQGVNNGKPEGGMLDFLRGDGNYSEFVHKARWGIPDTIMTRTMLGEPDSQDMIDVMLYLQELNNANPEFIINAGLNDSWYYPETDGQGFFITVFPDMEMILLSWFTYDTERPPDDVTANLGEPGHRWFNALGTYSGNEAVLDITIASGGIFDTQTDITEVNDGTITLTFSDCENGIVEYDIPSIDQSGIVPIQRVVDDNVAVCEALYSQMTGLSTDKTEPVDTVNTDSSTSFTEATPLSDMNPGLNDSWYNPVTTGQGFFITVFPDFENVLLSWFTYDTERPADNVTANLGEPGHRWFNALGKYNGNQAVLDITIASGGLFDTQTEITEVLDGTITLTFSDCESGLVEYDIPSINQSGTVPIERVVDDNIALCEEFADQ